MKICGEKMTEEQKVTFRMSCLCMASSTCGAGVDYEYVLEAAKEYAAFVLGNKPTLRVVSNDGGDAA